MTPYPLACQIYSARLFPPLLPQLPEYKAMGYDAIEPWLPAYGDDPAGFRAALDDAGLRCIGFHMPLSGLAAETARFEDIALTLGATYMIPPYVTPEERRQTAEYWRGLGETLAKGAEAVSPSGLRVLWHNHDFEFRPLPTGERPIDLIFEAAGPAVGWEIDLGWIRRAGADPAAELARYADRIRAVQVKDMAPPGTEAENGWTATGDGIIDWVALAPLIRATAADHIVTEHDNPADWRAFAGRSAGYIRRIGL
jgi:sugar phosphate isomerase/epimerase